MKVFTIKGLESDLKGLTGEEYNILCGLYYNYKYNEDRWTGWGELIVLAPGEEPSKEQRKPMRSLCKAGLAVCKPCFSEYTGFLAGRGYFITKEGIAKMEEICLG